MLRPFLTIIAVLVAIKPIRYAYNNFLPERFLRKMVKFWDKFFHSLIWLFAGVTVTALGFIIWHILSNGLRHLALPGLFNIDTQPGVVSLFPAIVSTVIMVVLVLLIAVPFGVLSAVFLVEYTGTGNKFVTAIRSAAEVLASIPSIVYGLFGMMFFRVFLGLAEGRPSVISGTLTMSIMMLPLIMRTTEEALKAVPCSYREGSFALGAGKLRTVFRIVLPSAMPGMLSGIILAIGRVVGESAALIFTSGALLEPRIPRSIFDTASTLTVHMWQLSNYGRFVNETYAAAVVLLVLVLILNALSAFIARKFSKV